MLIWTYMNKLLLLEFQSFPFAIHDSFQLFEMPQFDFEFFHLGFNQQSNKGFDFPFLNCSQVFGFYSRRGESWNKKRRLNIEHISIWKIKVNERKNEQVIYINLVLKSQFVCTRYIIKSTFFTVHVQKKSIFPAY